MTSKQTTIKYFVWQFHLHYSIELLVHARDVECSALYNGNLALAVKTCIQRSLQTSGTVLLFDLIVTVVLGPHCSGPRAKQHIKVYN